MPRPKFETVDAYIAAQAPDAQKALTRVRATMRKALPKAQETISYQIPTFKQHGTNVVYFAGYKSHYSIYPANDDLVSTLGDEVKDRRVSKGTLQFSYSEPVPVALIRRVAKFLEKQAGGRAK